MSGKVETTCELVRRNAAQYPDTPFLHFYDEIITYQGLDERTNAFANFLLEKGMGRGDVVSYMLGNSPAVFDVLLGAQKIGAIAGPISCWWQANEVEYLVNDSRSKVLVVDPEYVPIAAEIADLTPSVEQVLVNAPSAVDLPRPHECLRQVLAEYATGPPRVEPPRPDDTAALMYTSGTTGEPKGVMLSHGGVLAGARIKTEGMPISAGDRALCVLPLFHSGGLNDLALPTMYRASTIVLRRGFSASEFWECIERYRINAFYIVPTMWNILLRATESGTVDASSLRFGISGAAPIPPEQLEECKERFGVPILEAYGLTESSGGIAANTLERSKYGSVGLPFDGLELRVFDPDRKPLPAGQIGEIVVRGDVVMKGYWGRAEATAETIVDGWLHRRPRLPRRRRLPLHRGPQEGDDHPGGTERLPEGDRERHRRASGRGGSGGDPRGPRQVRAGRQGLRGACARGAAGSRRASRVLRRTAGGVQGARGLRVPRQLAAQRHREGGEEAAGAGDRGGGADRAGAGGAPLRGDARPLPPRLPRALSGSAMKSWLTAGLTFMGMRAVPTPSLRRALARLSGCPVMAAPEASAWYSRAREIAILINMAAIGARIRLSRAMMPLMASLPRRRPIPPQKAIRAKIDKAAASMAAIDEIRMSRLRTWASS